jgi:uncharacterized protein YaaN involved in tellurite resistance
MTTEADGVTQGALAPVAAGEQLPALRVEIASEYLVPLDAFDAQQRRVVQQIDASVSLDDTESTDFFAGPVLKRLSDQLDRTLSSVRTDDVGDKGAAILLSVRDDFNSLRLPDVKAELLNGKAWKARLPVIGGYFSAFVHMRAMHRPVLEHLEKIKLEAETQLGRLRSVLVASDQQYVATEEAIDGFSLWLAGGQQAWLRMRREYRAEAEAAVGGSDLKRLARLRDKAERLDAFAASIVELRIAHLGFIASLPQIRMAQKAARIEVQNTLQTIFLDLPKIKAAVQTMCALNQIAKASENSGVRKQMAQDLARLSADMTAAVYTKALASEGDFDGGVQTVEYIMTTVVGAIDQGLGIRDENIAKRDAAIQRVDAAQERFTASLRASAARGLAR